LCAAPALQTASETPKIAFAPSFAETINKEQTHDTFRSSCYRQTQAGDVEMLAKLFPLLTCRPLCKLTLLKTFITTHVFVHLFLQLSAPNNLGQNVLFSLLIQRSKVVKNGKYGTAPGRKM